MKEIPLGLNKEHKMECAIVDDEDYEWLNNYTWYLRDHRNTYYVVGTLPGPGRNKKSMYMHHAIVGFPLYGKVVDHINRNSLDNRRSNLRIVTQRENRRNTASYRNGIREDGKGSFVVSTHYPTREIAEAVRELGEQLLKAHHENN